MSITFRPAVRQNTPLIIGIGGPTKSGKTYSAHRLAIGLATGGTVAMINAEGPRGHQYADKFKYVACELAPPFRPTSYTEALLEVQKIAPAVVIIDSASHMHDGPGGILEWHEEILDRIAGKDYAKRNRSTFTAWVEPKAAENQFIYTMLGMQIPVILCLRAKEKLKIVPGKEPVDLGWQPIVGERVAFETMFTLMLPPHSKGTPDLSISDMREPFDAMVPTDKPIDEDLGAALRRWAGGQTSAGSSDPPDRRAAALEKIRLACGVLDDDGKRAVAKKLLGVTTKAAMDALPVEQLESVLRADTPDGITPIEAEVIRWKEAHPVPA